jgi:hypothetical protein
MRKYGKVSPRIWTGKLGKSLRGDRDAQVMALYLITSPHANMIGLYFLPLAYASSDLGMSEEGASKALRRISEGSFCRYDEESERVWVIDHARHECGDDLKPQDKRVKGIEDELENHRDCRFFNDFLDMYAERFSLSTERNSKPLRSPFEAPSKPLRSQKQDQDQKQDQGQEQPAEAGKRSRSTQRSAAQVYEDPEFVEFWDAYPKKVSKGDAAKAWAQTDPEYANGEYVKRPPEASEVVLAAKMRSKCSDWKEDGGKWIPNAATWLRNAGWNDELPAGFGKKDNGGVPSDNPGWSAERAAQIKDLERMAEEQSRGLAMH